jgi:hypothetical protein
MLTDTAGSVLDMNKIESDEETLAPLYVATFNAAIFMNSIVADPCLVRVIVAERNDEIVQFKCVELGGTSEVKVPKGNDVI